eukprot:8628364-Pyramimonas_sp.AAC.1
MAGAVSLSNGKVAEEQQALLERHLSGADKERHLSGASARTARSDKEPTETKAVCVEEATTTATTTTTTTTT